jgi:hypothetical protein
MELLRSRLTFIAMFFRRRLTNGRQKVIEALVDLAIGKLPSEDAY